MKRLCVIGDPVGHSLSPVIHRALMDATGVEGCYTVCPVTPAELPDFVSAAKGGAWDGFNVTMPHKQAILPLLDDLTPQARHVGAVNTVRVAQGRAVGHNTDGIGFVNSLQMLDIHPYTVLLLGAGGAGCAVAAALADAGVKKILLWSRGEQRRQALEKLLPGTVERADSIEEAAFRCNLLINATPLGMTGKESFADLSFLSKMRQGTAVYDLVYQPRMTALLRTAGERGLTAVSGLELLIGQAVEAFTFFTGIPLPPESRGVIRNELKNRLQ